MRIRNTNFKLRPHYFWLCGLFVVGGVIAATIQSGEPEETHAAGKTMADITYMQEITPEICKNSTLNQQYTLKDKRDNKEYTIARILNKDGGTSNCWMTSNLAFDVKTLSMKMTTDLSDVTTDKSSWADGVTLQSGSFTRNSATSQYSTDAASSGRYGYYYSWCAATAGTCSDSIANEPGIRSASMSICPKGWKLPTGGKGGQFTALFGADNSGSGITVSPRPTDAPYKYLLAGAMNTDDVNAVSVGSSGSYWSSSSYTDTDAYFLFMNSSKVWPANLTGSHGRYLGYSVRCIAATALDEIATMQQMTADVCAKANVGDTANLKDERDGKYYTVAKIQNANDAIANCWMTSNLAFDLRAGGTPTGASVILDPETSDVARRWPDASSTNAENRATVSLQNGAFTDNLGNLQYSNNGAGNSNYKAEYGYYYSWCAATANSCTEVAGVDEPGVRSATQSICPKGWKLPTGGSGGQFTDLFGADVDSNGITVTPHATAFPYSYVLSGNMNTSGFNNGGTYGRYWSSSSYSDTVAYGLSMDSSIVWSANTSLRYVGYSVRCVADPDRHSENPNKDSTSADFSVVVNDAITLSSVEFSNSDGTSNTISAMPGQLATGNINVNVGSNVKYKIMMNSQSPDLASKTDGNTNIIPAITTTMTADQLKTNYGWGILKKNSDNTTDDTIYTGLTPTDQTFYTSPTPAGASKVMNFGVGVGVPPTIPADTYSTEVTITAIATE